MKKIIERLKQVRQSKGLKQKDMAKQLGVSTSAYSKIENGRVDLTVKNLLKIAAIFDDISMDWFLTGRSAEIQGFGKYADDVREMLDYIAKNKASMHSLLSYFYELKDRKGMENELKSQRI